MKHEALFTFHTPDAQIIALSLQPESNEPSDGRSMGICTGINTSSLELHIKAEDLTAFRAALNSWLRLIQVAEEMVQTSKKAGRRNT